MSAPEPPVVPTVVVEPLGPAEQRVSFRHGDSWCRATNTELRSGVRMSVSACHFEPSFSFVADQQPAEIELIASKGGVLHARTHDGHDLQLGGNALQLARSRHPLRLRVQAAGDLPMECVSISMSAHRLRELLGAAELPEPLQDLVASEAPHRLVAQAMTPGLFRLLEEIANTDVRGPARLLWNEAKSLELIALITDEIVESARTSKAPLCAHDVHRLERARLCLIEHLDAPPTLADLARSAGFSETKLKGGFRALFGASIFTYLRQIRMEEARRLLLEDRLNVTEAAQRVGYSNPSKFAAAFRRQFGMSPSAL